MKKTLIVLALCAVAVPALAQTAYASSPIPASCPAVFSNMTRGARDYYTQGQVSQLQGFLAGYYGDYRLTGGYYGPLTYSYVARFQREQGLQPITGGVGPLTRAAIARICSGVVVPPVSQGSVSITGVSGPNAMTVGQTGTWAVSTNAPYGAYLSTSVRWGDENQYGYGLSAAMAPSYVSTQNTFTHSYNQAGTYTIAFTVSDSTGRTTSASATVVVTGGTTQQGLSASPSSGAAPLTVTFTPAQSASGYWAIQFGDGQSANSLQGPVTHTYATAGTYTATATTDLPCLHTTPQCYTFAAQQLIGSATVQVTGGTTNTGVSVYPHSGTAPLTATFTINSSNTYTGTYAVDFGDGQSASMQSGPITHTYYNRGTYTAQFTSDIACMHTNPRCMIATMLIGSAVVTAY